MRRGLTLLAAVLAVSAVAMVAREAPSARACTIARFATLGFERELSEATIVALGTFEQATKDTVQLRVEEYLKGEGEADRVEVNNHVFGIGGDCSLLLDEDSPGYRFADGDRVLVFLEPDAFGLAEWRPTYWGYGVLAVEGDALFHFRQESELTVDQIRALVHEHGEEPTTIDYEYIPPCERVPLWPVPVPEYTRMASLVALGRIQASDEATTTLEVLEYWKGEQPERSLTVNNQFLWDQFENCEPVLDPAVRFYEDREVIIFLQRDDFGIGAEVRPVAWNLAVLAIRDGYTVPYPGLMLLSEVRELAGGGVAPGQEEDESDELPVDTEDASPESDATAPAEAATQDATEEDAASRAWWLVGGAIVVVALGGVVWGWSRRR